MPDTIPDCEHQTILVVDDDNITCDALGIMLEASGYRVVSANTGRMALSIASREEIDMAILDVVMPDMDGFEICKQLRQMEGLQHSPILMLTSLDDAESAAKAFETGATDFISKPINWTLLQQRVRYICRNHRMQQLLLDQTSRLRKAQDIAKLVYAEVDGYLQTIHLPLQQESMFGIPCNGGSLSLEDFSQQVHEEDREDLLNALQTTLYEQKATEIDFRVNVSAGSIVTLHQIATPSHQPHSNPTIDIILQDISEQAYAKDLINFRTFYDSLTRLPNLKKLHQDLDKLLADDGEQGLQAIIYIKIGRLKHISETLGHLAANQLVQSIAQRLSELQSRSAHLYRTGSTQFVLLLINHQSSNDAIDIAHNILTRVTARPYQIENHELNLTTSIGMTLYPQDNSGRDDLLKHAESAASLARQNGGNRYQIYSNDIQQHAEHRLSTESDLRRAITQNQLFLYYQPQVSAQTQEVVGMECLLRWHHPDKGLVSPFEFISIAEETDLIHEIGQWLLSEAFQNTRYWHEQGYPQLRVGINLSARQFEQDDIVTSVKQALHTSAIDPARVELEITESAAMANFEQSLAILNEFKSLGVKISIDDFGTGHSSLSYLRQLPVDTLKIDRAFVKDIGTPKDDGTIAHTIVDMAHNLKLNVIAEGVENETQLRFLQQCHCDEIQGYLFSRPLPGNEFSRYLAQPRNISLNSSVKSAS